MPAEQTRFRAIVEYDGTDYCGFQRQRSGIDTIQGAIERVLSDLVQGPVTVTGAGRTDSGVHALGQVISFTIEWRHDAHALQRALNANLPEDIAIKRLEETDDSFHPRYDARRRSYVYLIYNAPVRSPLQRRHAWHVVRELDLAAMNEAAGHLPGRRDFATFGVPPQGHNTVRDLFEARWEWQGLYAVFHVQANAFLYRMVRSLVGSLVAVGTGVWTVGDFRDALAAADRNRSAAAAPPQGLYLSAISYEV